jgi:predicted acyltransferase
MPEIPIKTARPVPVQPKPISKPGPVVATPNARVLSLDALRGFDMFWIIGGDKLALAILALIPESSAPWVEQAKLQFKHVDWEGFHFYDLIMPLFLFVVGAAMPFSFARRAELGHSKSRMMVKLLSRTVILFILGMAVQGHLLDFNLDKLHPFSNTLQAIAVGYFFSGIFMLFLPVWAQIGAAIFLMLLYWGLLMFIPVPIEGQEAVRGVLKEHANVAYMVEQWVMGRFIDHTDPPYTWVLSGMTFTSTTLLGVFAGYILRGRSKPMMRLVWLVLLGAVCLGAGWAWAKYLHFPIIKHIWTSSMVLWAAGWSYLLLALFYLVIDVIGLRLIAFPLVVIGMNAIVAYVAYHLVIPFDKISTTLVGGFASHFDPHVGSLILALTTVFLVWLLLYHLYRHKIFLRI